MLEALIASSAPPAGPGHPNLRCSHGPDWNQPNNSNFAILPANENNTFLIMDPTPILDTRDICNIRCYGDPQVGDDMDEACGAPTRRIERGTAEFDRYMYSENG